MAQAATGGGNAAPRDVLHVPFATEVSAGTGLDFYTVLGWAQAEGGPVDNPLNLDFRKHPHYASAHDAAQQVVGTLTRPAGEGGHYGALERVARAKYPSADSEIAAEAHAIAVSPWNNPADAGSASTRQYEQNIKAGALSSLYTGIKPGTVPDDPTGGSYHDTTPDDPLGLGGIGSALSGIGDAFGWLTNAENWKRTGLAVLGGALIVGGLLAAFK